MVGFIEFVASLGPWVWVCLAVFLFVLETIVPGVHFVWFGVAAMIVGGLLIGAETISPEFAAQIGWQYETIVFALLSMITIFFFRGFAGDGMSPSDMPNLNVRGQQYVGRAVTVAEAIQGGRGKVKIGDTLWLAEGPDVPKGAQVTITGVNGTALIVESAA
ncbi:MAG: NfeD family protein [Pseudomonadota bacterium]